MVSQQEDGSQQSQNSQETCAQSQPSLADVMARLVAITGPMDEAQKADLIAVLDPILKLQVVAALTHSLALGDEMANVDREHQADLMMFHKAISRIVDEKAAVQKKLDAANARIAEFEGAAREE